MSETRFFVMLLCLLLLSLISYCVKWPRCWHNVRYRKDDRHKEVVERVEQADSLVMEVADVVIQLRTNAERLERALKKLKEEEEIS